jgi:hypothetical protein
MDTLGAFVARAPAHDTNRPAGANLEWDLAYAATHSINIPLASAANACLCFE